MWFGAIFDLLGADSRRLSRRPRRRTASSRLLLEVLEDRTLPSFAAQVTYPVGTGPQAIATADLRHDGKLDLVTANFGANTISVQLGNGNGTFGAATSYAVGTEPAAVAVGDFNGDGKLDIVTANEGDNTVSVLIGNGDGTFQAAKSYAVGSQPVSVAVGDFDGKLDIVTANQGDDTVSLLPGNGDGTFGAVQKAASLSAPAQSLAVGDFNGDGKLDLAVATRGTDGFWTGSYGQYYFSGASPLVTVLLGNGNGTFTTDGSYTLPRPLDVPPSSFPPPSMTAADLNGDGKPDLVVTDAYDGAVDVLLNSGNGTFTGPTPFSNIGGPVSVAVADLNGDGKPDVVTTNWSDTVSVLPGNGKGEFGNPYMFTVGSGPVSVAAGGFNGDGLTDLAVATTNSNNVSVLLNNGYWPSLQVTATDPNTGAPISSTTAGQSFTVTVTALDPSGNVLTGFTDTVSFGTASDTQATIIDPATGHPVSLQNFTYTFTAADHGRHTFSVDITTAGTEPITVSDASAGIMPTGPDIGVSPAAIGSFQIRGFPSPITAGQSGQFAVAAYDIYGNPATNYTGTVVLSSTDPTATFFDISTGRQLSGNRYTFSASDYGTHYFDAVLNTVGSQSITATDSVNANAAGSETGIQVNLAATVSGPSASYINQTLAFTLGTIGDPAGTDFTYQINWGDGSPVRTVTGPSGTQVTHVFSAFGTWDYTLTATDPDGRSATAGGYVVTEPITVAIQTDPAHTSQQMLVINDTSSDGRSDSISLASAANNSVSLAVDNYDLGTIAPTNGKPFALVMAFAGAGWEVTLDATSLAISSVLVGGSAGSWLYGGSARNLLIAGPGGSGELRAGSAGDILIGGTTNYDSNTTALAYLMAEWDSSDGYATRINKISKGGGLNGSYLLNGTTVSDNGCSDYLYAGAGLDWFFAHTRGKTNKDYIYYYYGQTSGRVVTNI
jgi:hypothetical protein